MPAEKPLTLKLTADEREHFRVHLGYIRCWAQGFAAAGKSPPHVIDTLRQIQIWLGDAK